MDIGGGGYDCGCADHFRNLTSQPVRAAQVPGKKADCEVPSVIEGNHGRIDPLVFHMGSDDTHHDSHRHDEDMVGKFFEFSPDLG